MSSLNKNWNASRLPGDFDFARYPLIKDDSNPAIDQADIRGAELIAADLFSAELIAADMASADLDTADLNPAGQPVSPPDTTPTPPTGRIAVFEDAFGVLSVLLAAQTDCTIDVYSDSLGSLRALEYHQAAVQRLGGPNLQLYAKHILELDSAPVPNALRLSPQTASSEGEPDVGSAASTAQGITQKFDAAVIRLPRSADYLGFLMVSALGILKADAPLWIGGMDKRWSPAAKQLCELVPGSIVRGRFEKRSRWVRIQPTADAAQTIRHLAVPADFETEAGGQPLVLTQLPGVFSMKRLDPAARLYIEHIGDWKQATGKTSALPENAVVADLGCGNGVLGIVLQRMRRDIRMVFCDDSRLSLASAQYNWKAAGLEDCNAAFIQGHLLEALPDAGLDAVMCNPPFHFRNIQTREIARGMFEQARRCLKPGGTLRIIGNSHLGYHKMLEEVFATRPTQIYRDERFTILEIQNGIG